MLHSTTLHFITDLSVNNNKPWFDENRERYNHARADFEQLVESVLTKLAQHDSDVAPLKAKDCIFRQYRDIRFSKDKTPYKTHLGASFDRGGKSSGFAGYYLHVQPGNKSMAGGGIWMPEAAALKKIRQEIDYNLEEFESILRAKPFVNHFGALEQGEYKLSREPRGYDKANPAIEYLKLKSLVATKPLSDGDLTSPGLQTTVLEAFTALTPLLKFINRAIE